MGILRNAPEIESRGLFAAEVLPLPCYAGVGLVHEVRLISITSVAAATLIFRRSP